MPISERIDNALFAAYQAMRTAGLLLLADYLDSPAVSRTVASAIRGLRLPHWADWSLLCDKLARLATGRDTDALQPGVRLVDLAGRWQAVNGRAAMPPAWLPLLAGLAGNQGTPARSLNDAVWKARNERAHRQGTRTGDASSDTQTLMLLLPVVQTLAEHLFPMGAITLLRRVPGGGELAAFQLHGSHHLADSMGFEAAPAAAHLSEAFDRSDVVAVVGEVGIPLYPLFVATDPESDRHELGAGGLVEPVTLLDGANERRVVLRGVRCARDSQPAAESFAAALRAKQVDLGLDREQTKLWTLADWSAVTARGTLEELTGRKYFPQTYFPRAQVESAVDSLLSSPGRALLLLGEAGSGKSSYLAHFVDRLLGGHEVAPGEYLADPRGDVVLFLSGRADLSGDASLSSDQVLAEAVGRKAGIRPRQFETLESLCAHLDTAAREDSVSDRKVVLILDALNEADRFTDLIGAVDRFLACVPRYPWLRLAVSIRSGAYHALERRRSDFALQGQGVFEREHVFLSSVDVATPGPAPYIELEPFRLDDEGPKAYALRQERMPERSCRIPWLNLPAALRQVLLSPLFLHLFHEAFCGTEVQVHDLDEGALLDAYLDKLSNDSPVIGEKLPRIGRLMYENRSPDVPEAEVENWVADWRRKTDGMNWVARLDPVEEMVAATFVARIRSEPAQSTLGGLRLAYQRLSERVLHRELIRQIEPRQWPSREDVVRWVRWSHWARVGADGTMGYGCVYADLKALLIDLGTRCGRGGFTEPLTALFDIEEFAMAEAILVAALKAEPAYSGQASPVRAFLDLRLADARNDLALASNDEREGSREELIRKLMRVSTLEWNAGHIDQATLLVEEAVRVLVGKAVPEQPMSYARAKTLAVELLGQEGVAVGNPLKGLKLRVGTGSPGFLHTFGSGLSWEEAFAGAEALKSHMDKKRADQEKRRAEAEGPPRCQYPNCQTPEDRLALADIGGGVVSMPLWVCPTHRAKWVEVGLVHGER